MVTVAEIKKNNKKKETEILKCLIVFLPVVEICFLIVEKIREPLPIFFVSENYSVYALDLRNIDCAKKAGRWGHRFRSIIDKKGIFRCEDLDMFSLNSKSFKSLPAFVSGSTYVKDGNLKIFQDSVSEIEEQVKYYISSNKLD